MRTSFRVASAIAAAALIALALAMPFLPARPFSEELMPFPVENGVGLRAIAGNLKKKGIILSSAAFTLASKMSGRDRSVKAGVYALSPGMSPFRILDILAGGKSESFRLTIPEGYSLRKIARKLEEKGLGKERRFLDCAQAYLFETRFPWLKGLPPDATLEGYLFPDTYCIGPGTRESELLTMMLDRFGQAVLPVWRKNPHPLPFHQTITLASIVEREAAIPEERPLIAGVFYNRLRTSMPLGSDPTVEYALGRHQGNKGLSIQDILVRSPYNTYRNKGLPPGPIGSPGLASIESVLHSENTPFLYFVAQGNGRHHFSRTLTEQIEAQKHYQNNVLRSER